METALLTALGVQVERRKLLLIVYRAGGEQVENYMIQGISKAINPLIHFQDEGYVSFPGLIITNGMHRLELILHPLNTCSYSVWHIFNQKVNTK